MELKEMVVIQNDEPMAGTWLLAQGFEKEHRRVVELIEKYRVNFENFSRLERRKFKSTGGRPVEEYLLTEPQAAFLGTLFRNNEKVVKFKEKLIKEFFRMKTAIIRAKAQSVETKWIEARADGKVKRLKATGRMKEFRFYAETQGSTHAEKYYMNITKMTNAMLFIVDGKYKNLRDLMTPRQLMVISAAEGIIDKALKDGMKKSIYYKDIYKLVKERVELFAELHGQSEVISKQLSLKGIDTEV